MLAPTPGGSWVGHLDLPVGGVRGLPLVNVRVEGENIVIVGDVIRSVSTDPLPDDVPVLDVAGPYVIPGLFDLHAHIQPFDDGVLYTISTDPTRRADPAGP